jgi:pilus assembly protein Flp/PilA
LLPPKPAAFNINQLDNAQKIFAIHPRRHPIKDLLMLLQTHVLHLIKRFRRDDEGAALVEYGMLVGLIAVICVVAVTTLGTEISTAFSNIAGALSGL